MTAKNIILQIGKYSLIILLLLFLWLLHNQNQTREVSVDALKNAIVPDTTSGDIMAGDANKLRKYYGISPEDIEGFSLYIPANVMSAEELLILKSKSAEDIPSLALAVQERLNSQKNNFSNYGVDQTAKLNQAKIITKGKYLFFAVSDNADRWEHDFKTLIKR